MTTVKMQPFWWFLRPPYVWPCWYDECESVAGWAVGPHMSVSLDPTAKKEGSYSVRITSLHMAGGPTESCIKAITQCNRIVGLWLRADLPAEGCIFRILFETAAGAYISVLFCYSPDQHRRVYEIDVNDPAHGSYSIGTTPYTNLTWVWFELLAEGYTTEGHINGVGVGGGSGYTCQPWVIINVVVDINAPTCNLWLDWMRIVHDYEYPPTYPY
jgi:hypothetical protein